MNKRDFVRAGAFGSLALGAASAAQAQSGGPSYQWKMATGWPGGPLTDVGAKLFAERMEQFSGGRFKIQPFPGGAIGNALLASAEKGDALLHHGAQAFCDLLKDVQNFDMARLGHAPKSI